MDSGGRLCALTLVPSCVVVALFCGRLKPLTATKVERLFVDSQLSDDFVQDIRCSSAPVTKLLLLRDVSFCHFVAPSPAAALKL
jgi:hypothetical protein